MLRFAFKSSLALVLLFTLTATGAAAISGMQPPNLALAGFARCNYGGWCWLGIRPMVTTVREADHLLRAAGYERVKLRQYLAPADSELCNVVMGYNSEDFEIVRGLILVCTGHEMRMGDFEGIFGTPTGLGMYDPSLVGSDILVPFAPALIFDNAALLTRYAPSSIFDPMSYIEFTSFNLSLRVIDWNNFSDYAFCRLAPYRSGC